MEDQKTDTKKETEDVTLETALKQIEEMKAKTVSKEQFDKVLENNKILIEQIAKDNKIVDNVVKSDRSQEEIIKDCTNRFIGLSKGTSYDKVKALCDNYDDMIKLGLKVDNVDPEVVEKLKDMIAKSDGNPATFKELCATMIKAQ